MNTPENTDGTLLKSPALFAFLDEQRTKQRAKADAKRREQRDAQLMAEMHDECHECRNTTPKTSPPPDYEGAVFMVFGRSTGKTSNLNLIFRGTSYTSSRCHKETDYSCPPSLLKAPLGGASCSGSFLGRERNMRISQTKS
jgi:hypothetical protein